MKKVSTQIYIAGICVILGFLIIYQFKASASKNGYNGADITSEIEMLKNEKNDLAKDQAELSEQLKEYEENAAKETYSGSEIKKQLDNARMELGLVPVKGPGVEITLTKKNSFLGGNYNDSSQRIGEWEMVHLINLLWYAQADAIEVNDYRITPQTGIKDSGNSITIGSAGKINPSEKIIIKATGDVSKLQKSLSLKMDIEFGSLKFYDKNIVEKDEIIISKTTESLNSQYINPVK